jgi:hypothetical protein
MNTVNLGGKNRPVAYNLNAIIQFEELTGIDLSAGVSDAGVLSRAKNVRALAYCGLVHGAKENNVDVDFSIEDVGSWISPTGKNAQEFFKIFTGTAQTAEPATQPEESQEPKK